MTTVEDLTEVYPESSIRPLLNRMSENLLEGALAILDATAGMAEKVDRLVDAEWRGVQKTIIERDTEYAGLAADEIYRRHITKLLSDDYRPSENDNSLLIVDALVLHWFFRECGETDPLPMALIARGLASAGLLMKAMLRALMITREIDTDAAGALRAVDKQAAKRQPVVDAYYRVLNRPDKKPHQIVNEIHEKTGRDKKAIRRVLNKEGLLKFKGY